MNMLANKSYKKSFISSVVDPYHNARDASMLRDLQREMGAQNFRAACRVSLGGPPDLSFFSFLTCCR